MTEFLVAVPVDPHGSQDRERSTERLRDRLERTAVGYSPFVGPDYDAVPQISEPAAQGTLAALSFTRRGVNGGAQTSGDYWAVSAGNRVTGELLDSVTRRGGRLLYERPVWGQYATVVGERYMDRITAWNTVPALEAIHWAMTDEFVYVSNRPLLIALAIVAGVRSAVQLSTDYLAEYLLYGYSISGQTPFTGVQTLPVDQGLTVHGGRVSIGEVPAGLDSPLPGRHTLDEGAEALAAALTSAMDRTERDLAGRPLQVRVSGGKDSRLMLGLLRGRALEAHAVTHGKEADPDVRLGRVLVERAGLPHQVRLPLLADAEDLAGRVSLTVAASGGAPISEPHIARYRGVNAAGTGEGIMLGQWPLTKGGMAKRMRYPAGGIEQTILKQGGALMGAEVRAPFDDRLRDWLDRVPAANELEKLYLFARQFRSGRYLHQHVIQYSREAQIAYPISDAEVAAVCDALTMHEKVSERALFGALSRIWPEVMALPLDRSVWRFETNGPDPDFSGPHYEARHAALPPIKDTGQPRSDRPSEYSTVVAVQIAWQILASERAPLFASLLSTPMWQSVVATAGGDLQVPEEMDRTELVKYLWRVYVADVWLSRSWLPA